MAKKIGRKLLAFVAVVTAGQLFVFHHYNSLFTAANGSASTAQQAPSSEDRTAAIQDEINRLESQYKFVRVSSDSQYATYLDSNNVLHIEDLSSKKDVSAAKNPYKVEYVSWIENERVFVGEEKSPGNIELKTVDATDGTQTIVQDFEGLAPGAQIVKIAFSVYTNDIYILVNTSTSSVIYHVDTMKHIETVPIGGRYIKNIAISQTGDKLYFEDRLNGSYNVLYFDSNDVAHRVELNAALVDVVGNTLYYGDINQQGLVTSVYKLNDQGKSTLVKTLSQPAKASDIVVSDDGSIYVDSSAT